MRERRRLERPSTASSRCAVGYGGAVYSSRSRSSERPCASLREATAARCCSSVRARAGARARARARARVRVRDRIRVRVRVRVSGRAVAPVAMAARTACYRSIRYWLG